MYISIKPIWIPVIVAGALMTTSADAMEAEFPEPRTDRISVEHRVNVLDRELDLNNDQEGQLTTLFNAQDSQRRDFWHTSRAVTSTEICEMRDRHLDEIRAVLDADQEQRFFDLMGARMGTPARFCGTPQA